MLGTQWSVGDVTVTRIESSNFVLPSATAMPAWSVPAFAPSAEQTPIAFSALVEINGAEHLGPLRDARLLHPVEGPFEIDPSVSLVDAPGHNFGHVAVRIEDGSSLAIYPGHLVLSLLQVDDPDADAGELDVTTAAATRRVVLDELASRDGVLLTTLVGGPGGGVVQRSGSGYRLVT